MLNDLAALGILIAAVAIPLAVGAKWPRYFADLLWLFALARLPVALTTLAILALLAGAVEYATGLQPTSAISITIQIIVVPFLAFPASNYAAYAVARFIRREPCLAEPGHFIFETVRRRQREAYEAPRTAPD
ncbi:hypothetical protein [Sphingopyxis panaciterrae]